MNNNSKQKTNGGSSREDPGVNLRACKLEQCKARCCYDGVYLRDGEEKKIRDLVASAPDYFKSLPLDFIVDGFWDDQPAGRKTAVKSFESNGPDFPEHFSRTRCVFCSEDYKCMLQVFAVQRDLHKWQYKPESCWLFPLRNVNDQLHPPPGVDEPDPNYLGEEYPGYVKYVPCGQDRDDGVSWEETLAEEVRQWKKQCSNPAGEESEETAQVS
jgi:hypothetical protein